MIPVLPVRLLRPVLAVIVAAGGLLAAPTPAEAEPVGGAVDRPLGAPTPANTTPSARRDGPDRFRIASFNILGASHTDGRRARTRFERSRVRGHGVVKILSRDGIDLVGFQEMQDQQLKRFRDRTDSWRAFTGHRGDTDNTIAWRKSRFSFVRGWTVPVPYFHGHRRPMPVVRLQSRQTHRAIYVMNTHNPADTRGRAGRWRAEAVRIERRVTTRLSRRHHAPVFMTGDMNDRAAFFCPFTGNGVMHSFVGGSHRGGRCHAPDYPGVDWILGNHHVRFGKARVDRSRLVRRTTDHPVVSSLVRVRG